MKPHKHKELIKAWADGVGIEYRYTKDGINWSEWFTAEHNDLHWTDLDNYEYRLINKERQSNK